MSYVFWICRDCDQRVRLRKDGRAARHSGVNRFGQNSVRCVGSLYAVTRAAQQAERQRA